MSTAEYEVPDTYTILWLDGSDWCEVLDSPDRVDALTQEAIASCGTRDSWLHLTSLEGDEVRILASQVKRIAVSTAAGRARQVLIEKRRTEQEKQARVDAGYLPGDD